MADFAIIPKLTMFWHRNLQNTTIAPTAELLLTSLWKPCLLIILQLEPLTLGDANLLGHGSLLRQSMLQLQKNPYEEGRCLEFPVFANCLCLNMWWSTVIHDAKKRCRINDKQTGNKGLNRWTLSTGLAPSWARRVVSASLPSLLSLPSLAWQAWVYLHVHLRNLTWSGGKKWAPLISN